MYFVSKQREYWYLTQYNVPTKVRQHPDRESNKSSYTNLGFKPRPTECRADVLPISNGWYNRYSVFTYKTPTSKPYFDHLNVILQSTLEGSQLYNISQLDVLIWVRLIFCLLFDNCLLYVDNNIFRSNDELLLMRLIGQSGFQTTTNIAFFS